MLLACGLLLPAAGCRTLFRPYPRPAPDAIAPVVAVSSFENRSGFPGEWQLGSDMADLLVNELMTSRNFTVVERREFDRILKELGLQQTPHFRAEGRLDRGRLINVHYLVRGTITDFSQTGGGAFQVMFRKLYTLGFGGYSARVALTLTLVDVESGRIVDSVFCEASAGAGQAYSKAAYRDVAFGGNAFFKTPLGQATRGAIRQGVIRLIHRMPRQVWELRVAEAHDRTLILNGGGAHGLLAGDLFDVRNEGRPVTDPVTGDILAVPATPAIGRVRVRQVGDRIAYAEIVSGSGFRRGQRLTPVHMSATP